MHLADKDRGGGGLGESLGDYLREQRRAAQLSLRQLAERAEVSNPYLSQVERGLRQPSAQVLNQIARGLRISAHALYVRAGLLADEIGPDEPGTGVSGPGPSRPAASGSAAPGSASGPGSWSGSWSGSEPVPAVPAVWAAVQRDPHLLDRHKLLLLDLYETFRRDAAAQPNQPQPVQPQPTVTVSARSTP